MTSIKGSPPPPTQTLVSVGVVLGWLTLAWGIGRSGAPQDARRLRLTWVLILGALAITSVDVLIAQTGHGPVLGGVTYLLVFLVMTPFWGLMGLIDLPFPWLTVLVIVLVWLATVATLEVASRSRRAAPR